MNANNLGKRLGEIAIIIIIHDMNTVIIWSKTNGFFFLEIRLFFIENEF